MEAGLTAYKEVQGSICGEECVHFSCSLWSLLPHERIAARQNNSEPEKQPSCTFTNCYLFVLEEDGMRVNP